MRLPRRIISENFRNIVADALPGLERNPAYWRFLEYLFFGTWRDEAFHCLLIPQALLATIEGKQTQLAARNYRGRTFLDAFDRDVVPTIFDETNYYAQRCRIISYVDFHPPIPAALTDELRGRWRDHRQVYFDDGTAVTAATRQQQREQEHAHAIAAIDQVGCAEERVLLEYMNSLPPHRFTRMLDHIEEAHVVAAAIENETTRNYQLSILHAIEAQPQPFYQASGAGRTVRIFGRNDSLLALKREVRHVLTQDWIELDLRYCHLAICAREWNVAPVLEFLATGQSVWENFHEHYHIAADYPQRAAIKQVYKNGTYAAIYGMSHPNLINQVTRGLEVFGIEQGGQRFLAHPLIHAMLQARTEVMRRIRQDGGARTCFGTWLAIEAERPIRSILSQVAQAIELQLLYPVVELAVREQAQGTNQFAITLWQHDGFSIAVRDRARRQYWVQRIQELVGRQAAQLGIITALEEAG